LQLTISDIVVFFLLGDSPASEFFMPTFRNTLYRKWHRLYRQCVPKRRNINFRRRRITQKKEYNIQNK